MRRSLIFLPLLLASCSDYNLQANKEEPGERPDIDDTEIDTADTTDTGEAVLEECDGIDNDGDGEVDEGFLDHDGDGRADCVDDACDVEIPSAGAVPIDKSCDSPDVIVTDPWNVAIEWDYTVSSGSGVIVMPAIGNLTDDDGDGDVDEDDSPDIVFTTWSSNTLVALHGDGSGVIFERAGFDGNAGVTIADIDHDGAPEVIAATPSDQIVALNGAGIEEWRSAAFSGMQMYPQPTVADLDADGSVEVIFDIAVVAGATGATRATLSGVSTSWRTPVCADLDQDGTQEIILGEDVFSHTGALEWSSTSSGAGDFASVADVDGDPGGEVFFASGSMMYLHDSNGTLLDSWTIPGSNPGPTSVADFDGDGQVEIAVPANTSLSVWEMDGTMLWTMPINDTSGLAGCSGYDIDGDGAYEVLFADQAYLRIYDGATGVVRYENDSHDSGTLWEYPTVADVDGDGSAEIVVASNDYMSGGAWRGVLVLGHAGSGWPRSGSTWPTHDFAITNIEEDGAVPTIPEPSWQVYNVFRARPAVDDAAVDLMAHIVDLCLSGCDDSSPGELVVQVGNAGGIDSDIGVPVTLYRNDKGTLTPIGTQVLTEPVPAGRSLSGLVFAITAGDVGSEGFLVRVDDDGAGGQVHTECDESNNGHAWTKPPC